jgi:hypothetical protein
MEQSDTKHLKLWNRFTQLAAVLGLLASIAAVISVAFQLRSESRVIELQFVSADQLTSLPNVDGLKGEFFYRDVNVTDLWRLKIRFVNNGDVTLIGEGRASSLLQGSIPIQFPSDIFILDTSEKSGEFYVINQKSPNQIELTFSQWRPKEEFETILYVTSSTVLKSPPIPTVPGRPIIDGDVIVHALSEKTVSDSKPLLDKLPNPIALIGRVLGIIFALFIFGIVFYIAIYLFPTEYIKAVSWKRKNKSTFVNILKGLEIPANELVKLKDEPWTFYSYQLHDPSVAKKIREQQLIDWSKFPDSPTYSKFWQILISLLIGLFLCIICLSIIAGLIFVNLHP